MGPIDSLIQALGHVNWQPKLEVIVTNFLQQRLKIEILNLHLFRTELMRGVKHAKENPCFTVVGFHSLHLVANTCTIASADRRTIKKESTGIHYTDEATSNLFTARRHRSAANYN